jgi:hypothetical protein
MTMLGKIIVVSGSIIVTALYGWLLHFATERGRLDGHAAAAACLSKECSAQLRACAAARMEEGQ